MAAYAHWPVSITTVGASKGGTVAFRQDGKLHVTCVLKSTFKLVPDDAMKLVEPENLFCSELHYRDNPTRSIRATSDVVPYLPRVDIVLTGHAWAPQGQKVTTQTVTLGVYHGVALMEKALEVHGDRNGADTVPFDRMPLVYERALGGLGDQQNPYGTGRAPGSASPNIFDPKDPNALAGFGPIARGLRQRKVLRGNVALAALDESIIDLPSGFDWNYFHAAPADQRVASLMGNEWIVIEGMHPVHTRIASRLPTVRPIVTIFGVNPAKPAASKTVQSRIDIIRIDADNLTCSVIGRAIVQIDDERSLETMRIVAAVETESHSYAHMLTPPASERERPEMTVQLPLAAKLAAGSDGTLVLGDAPPAKQAMPFAAKKFEIEDEGTFAMDIASHHEGANKRAMPFAEETGQRTPPSQRGVPIPGAPWSPLAARNVVTPQSGESTITAARAEPEAPMDEPTRKFVRPDESALMEAPRPASVPPPPWKPEPAVVHTTPAAAPEAPSAPKPDATSKDFYAKTGTNLPLVTPPAPPPPRIPPKPAVNKSLYGGFGPPKKKT